MRIAALAAALDRGDRPVVASSPSAPRHARAAHEPTVVAPRQVDRHAGERASPAWPHFPGASGVSGASGASGASGRSGVSGRSGGTGQRPRSPSPPSQLGAYRLLRLIGSGRTTHVYLAQPDGMSRPAHVAVKVLREGHERDLGRFCSFVEDARALASLHHGTIARVAEIGCDAGAHYVVMDYLRGMSLHEAVQRHPGGLPLAFAITAIVSCTEALHHARATTDEEVHRPLGISLSDVMACTDGSVKLCQIAGSSASCERAYRSPEEARGATADARSDVFVLGAMLYQLVTGSHPFLDGPDALGARASRDQLPHAGLGISAPLLPTLASELSAVLMTALAREPSRRYRDGHELILALMKVAVRLGLRVSSAAIRQLTAP